MSIAAKDIVPLGQVRGRLTEIAEEVRRGAEKVITRNGEAYVALIDAARLDYYHTLEREHVLLSLFDEAERGLADAEAGRAVTVAELRTRYGR
jgi:predicted transcriptional regulator